MNIAIIIMMIEIIVILAVVITALVYAHRLELADDRSRQREARELADRLGIGGGADFIQSHADGDTRA